MRYVERCAFRHLQLGKGEAESLAQETALEVPTCAVFHKDRAESQLVVAQAKSVFLRKLSDLRLAIFVVNRKEALQVSFVNSIVFPSANLQFPLDSARKCLHAAAQTTQKRGAGELRARARAPFPNWVVLTRRNSLPVLNRQHSLGQA